MMRVPLAAALALATMTVPVLSQEAPTRVVAWGTLLNPDSVVARAQALARTVANPDTSTWRAKGDQKRKYWFAEANAFVNYRLVIPPTWDGTSKLPLMVFLHSGGANESTNLDANNGQLVKLAMEHGYALVSPLGYQGAYGFHLRLPAVFGQQAAANQQIAAVTANAERTNQLSETDVLNVLEIVLHEYPVDRNRMFLAGHSMGAGGTFYLGAKYPEYWAALAPLSGPFVQEEGYPWENIRPMPVFVTEGNSTASTAASRALNTYMATNGFDVTYKEVVADHDGMIALVLPDVFTFFNENPKTVGVVPAPSSEVTAPVFGLRLTARFSARTLRLTLPDGHPAASGTPVVVTVFDTRGRKVFRGARAAAAGTVTVRGLSLPRGVHHAHLRTAMEPEDVSARVRFTVLD